MQLDGHVRSMLAVGDHFGEAVEHLRRTIAGLERIGVDLRAGHGPVTIGNDLGKGESSVTQRLLDRVYAALAFSRHADEIDVRAVGDTARHPDDAGDVRRRTQRIPTATAFARVRWRSITAVR